MPTPDADLAADLADALTLTIDGLRYALDRPPERGGGKVVLSVQLQSGGDTPLRDRVDLYGFKERLRLAGLVADLFARQRREAIGHLAVHYSARWPTRAERLRFLLAYLGLRRLDGSARRLAAAVVRKAQRIAGRGAKR
jgi:hypothetical protein